MKKRTKSALIFIGIVIIACIIGFINACFITGGMNTDAILENQHQEKVIVHNILLTETKDGAKYWEIFAKTGEYINDKNKIHLREVIGNFYKKNEVVLSFKGDEGFYENKLKKVTLIKNAQLAAKNDNSMTADKIVWEGVIEQITAEGNVKVFRGDEIATISDKTVFTTEFNDFKIYGNTTTKLFDKGLK